MKIITIYFNATGVDRTSRAQYVHDGETYTDGAAANELFNATFRDRTKGYSAYVIDGSAIGHNISGGVFAFNLETQVQKEISFVRWELEQLDNEEKLTLNLFGHSRGGVAAFLMCQGLKDVAPKKLSINVVAIDPVPGNFVWTAYLDRTLGLNLSVASRCYDMQDCHNLTNMLVIFSNTVGGNKLPHVIGHAPVLPMFPKSTNVTVDVMHSDHMALQWMPKYNNKIYNDALQTIHMAATFLKKHGTRYEQDFRYLHGKNVSFENEVVVTTPIQRPMHFYNSILSLPGKQFKNHMHHQRMDSLTACSHHDYTYHVDDISPRPILMIKRPVKFILCAMFLTGLACTMLAATPVLDTQTLKIVSALLGLAAMAGSMAYLQHHPNHAGVKKPILVKQLSVLSSKDRDNTLTDNQIKLEF